MQRSLRKQSHNPKKLHVMDEGLVAAFEANPEGDVGRKLETTVLLHLHRRRRDRFCYADGGEVDLCTEDGTAFWNTCWCLSGADTARREQRSMLLGQSRARRARKASCSITSSRPG